MKKFLITDSNHLNVRLDKWLKIIFSDINQGFIEKNLRKGNIKVNSKKVISKYKLKLNDEIVIFNYSEKTYVFQNTNIVKKNIPSEYIKLFKTNILYENKNFIILNKWTGIATQGGSKINISIDHIIKSISEKFNLVHRLDRETSGLLIIAKDLQTTKYFGKLFKDQLIKKVYLAICQGSPKNIESEINLKINDKKKSYKKINIHNSL